MIRFLTWLVIAVIALAWLTKKFVTVSEHQANRFEQSAQCDARLARQQTGGDSLMIYVRYPVCDTIRMEALHK